MLAQLMQPACLVRLGRSFGQRDSGSEEEPLRRSRWGQGTSPPSDTTDLLRFRQSHFGQQDVEPRSPVDTDFQVVVQDGDLLDQLVQERTSFDVGGFFPESVEVERLQQFGDLFEPCSHVVVALDGGLVLLDVGADRLDQGRESLLLLTEQLGGQLAVVVQLQQLAALVEQVVQSVRRGWAGAHAGWRRLCAPGQFLADRFLRPSRTLRYESFVAPPIHPISRRSTATTNNRLLFNGVPRRWLDC